MAEKHDQQERRREGAEGAGAHQQGAPSEQAGQTNRRASGDNQKHERALRENAGHGGDTGRQRENDHQKTVQGKGQKGPSDKVGRDTGGGNQGSKGQNIDPRRRQDEHTGKKQDDADDNRGNR